MSNPTFEKKKKKKNSINLLSDELAHSVLSTIPGCVKLIKVWQPLFSEQTQHVGLNVSTVFKIKERPILVLSE